MPRRLRFVNSSMVEVTAKTIGDRYLLRPSPAFNLALVAVLARAQASFRVKIYGFCILSNHLHLLLGVADAAQMSGFMQYALGNVARLVNQMHDWKGRVWARRYTSIAVVDDEAAENRLRYILANGVKEGLVDRVLEWPGVHCGPALLKKNKLRIQQTRAGVPKQHELTLSTLPSWARRSRSWRRKQIRALFREVERQAKEDRGGKACLGARAVLAEHPHNFPRHVETTRAPLVHGSSAAARGDYQRSYQAFADAYRAASARLRNGETGVEFPPGAFPPRLPFVPTAP